MNSKLLRVRQLLRSLRAQPLNAYEENYVRGLLNRQQAELFFKLPLYEQRHALNVCRTLAAGGFGADLELMQAALLHDLGKRDPQTGRTIPVWAKCANVVLRTLGGGTALVARLASSNPQSWRYVFYLQTEHEARGARLAAEAQSSEKVVALLQDYEGLAQKGDPVAKALKWADDLN